MTLDLAAPPALDRAFAARAGVSRGGDAAVEARPGSIARDGDDNADLLVALSGGLGSLGIVGELAPRLNEVGSSVQSGVLLYDAARAVEIARRYRDYVEDAPDEVRGGLTLRLAPPAPFVPAGAHGRPVVAAVFLYAGEVDDGARELAHLEAVLGAPLAAMRDALPSTAFQRLLDPPPDAAQAAAAYRFGFLPRLCEAAIHAVAAQAAQLPSPAGAVILQPLGGGVARGTGGVARHAGWTYRAVTVWDDGGDERASTSWLENLGTALEAYAVPARRQVRPSGRAGQ